MTNSPFTTIALILLMVVAFYFLILRPQKKRQQAQAKTMNELTPGTRVLLGSGLFGTITWVGSKQAILEVAPGIEVTVLKQAIARVVNPGDEYSEPIDMVDEPGELDELDQLDELDEAQRRDELDRRDVPEVVDRPVHEVDQPAREIPSNELPSDDKVDPKPFTRE